jgi:histone acetyltransferase (RNA polymerase elongator complex component)
MSRAEPTSAGKPFVIPVFLPHAGCPHRCVFCNQQAIARSEHAATHGSDWRTAASDFLRFRSPGRTRSELAFYGGTFLGMPPASVTAFLQEAAAFVRAEGLDGIRFSTRPDSVSPDTLALIADHPVTTVELGAQSMSDRVLEQSERGHTAADTATALRRLRERGYRVGLQLMLGLPGETAADRTETARAVAALAPDFVRIYPTLVLAGSALERLFREGRYRPLTLEEAVALTAGVYRYWRQRGITVVRTGLQPTRDLSPGAAVVAGPHHPAFGELVQSACFREALLAALRRQPVSGAVVRLRVHPRDVSRVRGQGNAALMGLKREFGWTGVTVAADACLAPETIALPDGRLVRVYEELDA